MAPSTTFLDGIPNGIQPLKNQTAGITQKNGYDSTRKSSRTVETPQPGTSPMLHPNGISGAARSTTAQLNGALQAFANVPVNGTASNGHKPMTERTQPIAIVGMSVRLPGNVTTTDEFWELCSRGRSGVSKLRTQFSY